MCVAKMKTFEFYQFLRDYIANGVFHSTLSSRERSEMRRASSNFVIKDGRLFYVGPNKQYMRLVVLTEEEKRSALVECHNNHGTGNHHGVRGTRDRVIAGYFWSTLKDDVTKWVRHCQQCQFKDPRRKQAPVVRPVKVNTAWEVVGLDLIGPLPVTARGNQYAMTMTDLYTKWVTAEPLRCNSASEVSAAIVGKMYTFGMVRQIITDQGEEFVNELNEKIFEILRIKHSVSSACQQQTNRQDGRTNMRHIRKYVSENDNNWDLHLPAVVYGINTALQASTRHTPFFLMFHRHPRLPVVMNACPMGDAFEVGDPEEDIGATVTERKALNDKVLRNIEKAQARQQESSRSRKRKSPTRSISDYVHISDSPSKWCQSETLASHHQEPLTFDNISAEGVATVVEGCSQES